jgi:hypothetical protein
MDKYIENKMDLKQMECDDVCWINLSRYGKK